jgi:hypothetical protein
MATVFNRAMPANRTIVRRPANNAKFSGADRMAIIFGSSIALWTIIIATIVHFS